MYTAIAAQLAVPTSSVACNARLILEVVVKGGADEIEAASAPVAGVAPGSDGSGNFLSGDGGSGGCSMDCNDDANIVAQAPR